MTTNENNSNNKKDNRKEENSKKANDQAKSHAGSGNQSQKKNRKNLSKKKVNWIVAAVIPILLIGGGVVYFTQFGQPKFEKLSNEKTELKTRLNERDSLINEWVTTFNEVEEDLRKIRGKEQTIEYKFDGVELGPDKKEELLVEIEKINQMLEKNQEKIRSLNQKLRSSGVKIAALEDKISTLQATITSRDSSIHALKQVVEDKNKRIANLNNEVTEMEYDLSEKEHMIDQKNRIIDDQNKMLEKAYLAYGSYQELKEKGVLEKDGGFLWFGRNTKLQEDVSKEEFREINIMDQTTLPLHSKKAELITNHPKGSYEFVKDSTQKIAYLKIEDPLEFWKITNYAVLETKK